MARPPRSPGKNSPRPSRVRSGDSAGAGATKDKPRRPDARAVADAWGVSFDEAKEKKATKSARPAKGKAQRGEAPRKGVSKSSIQRAAQPPRDDRPEHDARPARKPESERRPARPPRAHAARPAPSPTRPHPARTSEGPDEPQRIAKLLARAGVASRREIERMIAEARITLHGEPVTTPATLLPSLKGVAVDGQTIAEPEATRLFLFHKPAGYLTTERDPAGRPTIYDRLPKGLPRVMPIGRLDMTTEGLLLLTTDGAFKRQMELPATGVERTYRARAFGEVSQAQLEELIDGVEVEGMRYGRIDANLERRTGRNQWIEMTLTEGKNREVRRVLEHLGLKVNRLIRTRYGPFELGDSAPGALVEVKPGELAAFRRTLERSGR